MSKKLSGSEIFKGALLIFALAIIPLISKLNVVGVSKYEYGVIRSSSQISDIFSYGKSVAICVVGAILLFMMLSDFFIEEKKFSLKKPCFILAGIYLLFNILSALFSPYKYVALNGISERYEGLWVIMSYMVFFVSACVYVENKTKAKVLLLGIALSGIFVGLVGALQYIGIDYFKSEIGTKLVLGSAYEAGKSSLSIKFDSVYSTLYNPNCVGLFTGMMFPMSLILAICLPVKSKLKYLFCLSAVLMFVCLIGCDSVGGLLGMACGLTVAAIAALIYFINKRIKKGIAVILGCIALFIVGGVIFASSNATIKDKLNVIINAFENPETISNPNYFESMSIEGYVASIDTKFGMLDIDFSEEIPALYYDNEPVELISSDENTYNYAVEGLAGARIESDEDIYSFVATDEAGNNTTFLFGILNNEVVALDKFGTPVDITEEVPSFGFEGWERLGSNRGYIWSRSLPLLLKNIIIGKGPDTFSLQFPQDDILGKIMYQGNPYIIVDKPHNMYLQIGINSGVISLIAFICLALAYIVNTIKSLFKSVSLTDAGIKLAVLSGVVGFLTAALTTDSVVSVTPVFWIVLGFGFGVNALKQGALEE